jgi:hypothetical protein
MPIWNGSPYSTTPVTQDNIRRASEGFALPRLYQIAEKTHSALFWLQN